MMAVATKARMQSPPITTPPGMPPYNSKPSFNHDDDHDTTLCSPSTATTKRDAALALSKSWGKSSYEELINSGNYSSSPLTSSSASSTQSSTPTEVPHSPVEDWPEVVLRENTRLRSSSIVTTSSSTTTTSTRTSTTPTTRKKPTLATASSPITTSSSSAHHRRRGSAGEILDTPTRVSMAFQTIDKIASKFHKNYRGSGGSSSNSGSSSSASSRRFGLDITGLRKALVIRLLGVEWSFGVGGRTPTTSASPINWLKRRPSASSSSPEFAMVVIWVMDVESGVEWRVHKSLQDFHDLHDEVLKKRPELSSSSSADLDYPLRKGRSDSFNVSGDRINRLEKYLRRLSRLTTTTMSMAPPGAGNVAKTVQDFVGATQRVDILTEVQHRPETELRQSLQVYVHTILTMPEYEQLLDAQISLIKSCDVERTEVIKNLAMFLDRFVAGIMSSYSETLRLIVQAKKPLLLLDDVDLICMSCIRRQLEVEIYVPMMKQVNARLEKEVNKRQETLLKRKMEVLQSLPQSYFGIPISHISVSSWQAAVDVLRRVGDTTTLPSGKMDMVIDAVKEVHALYRREHPEGASLGADDFLPIWFFVVAHCQVPCLLSIKHLLENMCDQRRLLLGEAGYVLACLEAAIEYLLNLDQLPK